MAAFFSWLSAWKDEHLVILGREGDGRRRFVDLVLFAFAFHVRDKEKVPYSDPAPFLTCKHFHQLMSLMTFLAAFQLFGNGLS